ncbi:MAG: S41 family peptidase [Candidatus Margulisbacteria bacterium]|jgi:hypothetical protein|nr:S41 family peptidase [Bacteroidales bacterium]MDD4528036.1 S41 family peptidase [Candidatus Margulisiibacteriota bacterium]MDY0198546.1 S41 family peptidase [Tenuifilaceae bacterium]
MIKQYFIFLTLLFLPILIYCQNSEFTEAQNIWRVKSAFPIIGEFEFYTAFEKHDSTLLLKSFENRDKFILGSFKAKLFRFFQNRNYKKSLVAIEIINNKGKIHSIFGPFELKDITISENNIKGDIFTNDNSEKLGSFTCEKITSPHNIYQSINNYRALCDTIIKITASNIYNPKLTESDKWLTFCQNLKKKSFVVYDDLEFLVLFFANARKVGFTHFSLNKSNINLERTLNKPQIDAKAINDSVVLLKFITLSGKTTEIDSIFNSYKKFKIKILDLRSTPGGNFKSTYSVASHLLKDTVNAGAFISRDCFINNTCRENINNLPILGIDEINNFSAILAKEKGIRIVLYPSSENSTNDEKLYILISNNTASSCEPLVYGLKKTHYVKLVGEHTLGAILSPSVFDIGNNYYLILPTADYLTSDGHSLDGIGVAPNVKIKSHKALNYVLKELKIK